MANSTKSRKPDAANFPRQIDIATVCVYGLSILSVGLFLFLPLANLLSPNPWQRFIGTIHCSTAIVATIVTVYAGHLSFPLLRGVPKILPQMRTLAFWATFLTFVANISGNLAYMRYNAPTDGRKIWLLQHTPLVHYLFMEYHAFTVLFAIPLGGACTWILWQYGDSILERHNRPVLTATCLALMAMMFFAIGGLVSGFNVTRIRTM